MMDELYLSHICHNYTEYNEEWNVFSAFNPSKCTHLEQWAADCAAPGKQSWTSCWSRDSNPQPWVTSGFKSNALSIRPTTGDRWNNLYTKPCNTPRPDLNQKHLIFKANTLPLNQQQNSGPISIRCIYEGILKYLNMSQFILALELVRMIATSCICLRLMSEKSAIESVEFFFFTLLS